MGGVRESCAFGYYRLIAVALGLSVFLLAGAPGSRAASGDLRFAPFYFHDDLPQTIILNGEIDIRSALSFRRALNARPDTSVLVLHSPGGLVQIALLIAEEVHERKMTTVIPRENECSSACAFIFLAGNRRFSEGLLGVHQVSSDEPDSESLQTNISDILEVLDRFGTPSSLITRMLRTPAGEMDYLDPSELEAMGVLGLAGGTSNAPPPRDEGDNSFAETEENDESRSKGAADWYLAVYPRLDFWGADLVVRGMEVETVGECAASCAGRPQCRVFTFNVSQKRCFLKDRVDISVLSDGALSGVFLPSSNDAAPKAEPIIAEFLMRQSSSYSFISNPFSQPNVRTIDACLRNCQSTGSCNFTTFTFGNQRPCRSWSAIPGKLIRNSKSISFDKIAQPVYPSETFPLN